MSAAPRHLGWEELLGEILAFNGERVAVMISGPETGYLPIAYLRGVLTRGTTTQAGGEVLMFRVADVGAARDDSGFFLLQERFLAARWEDPHPELTIETRDGTVRLFTDPDAAPLDLGEPDG